MLASSAADCLALLGRIGEVRSVLRRGIGYQTRDIDCWPLVVRLCSAGVVEPSDTAVVERSLAAIVTFYDMSLPPGPIAARVERANELIRSAQIDLVALQARVREARTGEEERRLLREHAASVELGYYRRMVETWLGA